MILSSSFTSVTTTLVILAAACPFHAAAGESDFAVVKPFVDHQTFLIGRLDVQQLPLPDVHKRLVELVGKLTGDGNVNEVVEPVARRIIEMREAFLQAGGRERPGQGGVGFTPGGHRS
mgnify:CR=1 FL=1